MKQIINSDSQLRDLFRKICVWDWSKPMSVEWKEHKGKRSIPSNDLSYVWYAEIAKARCLISGEDLKSTKQSVRYECKLRFGVPILREESELFRRIYDNGIKHLFTYEEKIQAMEILPVTSLMTPDQMNWYLRDLQMTMAQEEHIILMTPTESEYFVWSQQV